jgi:ATP-dependent RNA helicase RhlE
MFSATMPPELNRVASEALSNPQRVDLAPPSRPAAGITQAVYPVPRHLKTDLLDQVLLGPEVGSVLVFTRTKHGADRLNRQLQQRGHSVAAIHGDRTQSQRERALSDLKRGRVQVLVATDIASRGIDVDDISHVINYDVPRTPEDYVHRIGRTGRVEATGDAFTLMSPEEQKDVTAIERFLGRSIPRVLIPDFDYGRSMDRVLAPALGRAAGRGAAGARGRRDAGRREPGAVRGRVRQPAAGARPARSRDGVATKREPRGGSRSPGSMPAPVPSEAHRDPAHGRRPRRGAPDRRRRRM